MVIYSYQIIRDDSMDYIERYNRWLSSDAVDEATRAELSCISDKEKEDRFYRDLEFGTGGLRGVMAAGTNRMNVYTIRRATQGLAMEILDCEGAAQKGVAIAYDSRNNSAAFAREAAGVLCANGIKTYLFDDLRPTPMLSFAVRYLGCARGIVITASHNPKEYNGYKVYGEDGGQIPPETADRIIGYINNTDIFDDIKTGDTDGAVIIGEEVDRAYLDAVWAQSFGVDIPDDFKVVYTPIHGSGNIPVRRILDRIGVKNLFTVPEQEKPDGDFPTVVSPNPENAEAFELATRYAKEQNADLVFGTDPDSDRIGVVVRNAEGGYEVLNGNQTGALLCEYILRKSKEKGRMPKVSSVVKTIVTTEMVREIAESYGTSVIDVLTGFKFIGEKIKEFEENGQPDRYMFGLEESYGYLCGTYARDKDAVVAAMLIAEMAADYKNMGMTLYDALMSLYERYGYFKEYLVTKTLTGIDGAAQIKELMRKFRGELPFGFEKRLDYTEGIDGLPKSDVLKFILKDGWFAVRPSGTEPKIKLYFGVKADGKAEAGSRLEELVKTVCDLM